MYNTTSVLLHLMYGILYATDYVTGSNYEYWSGTILLNFAIPVIVLDLSIFFLKSALICAIGYIFLNIQSVLGF